jgi:DnaJ family protein C protein 8
VRELHLFTQRERGLLLSCPISQFHLKGTRSVQPRRSQRLSVASSGPSTALEERPTPAHTSLQHLLDLSTMEDDEEGDDYKVLANSLKDQGNEAFQAGDVKGAISYFSQAIDLDPDNHVFYSNRSAAYMKDDSKSKALKDAEKCVELAPDWAKGYGRLGAAQQGLKRFDAGEDSFKKGIELDPNGKALWASLKSCQEAHEADKKAKCEMGKIERASEEAMIKRRGELKKEAEEKRTREKEALAAAEAEDAPKNDNAEDDLLASFFSEVAPAEKVEKEPPKVAVEEKEGRDESALTEKYATQDLGEGRAQFDRLTGRHCEWRNLNPFAVLQLGWDATEEDIKQRFRKMSLKVHPDRLRDVPNARDAFEAVKDAYAKLTDESLKKNILMHMEGVEMEVKKTRRGLLKGGKKDTDLGDFEEEVNREAMKHFAGTLFCMRHLYPERSSDFPCLPCLP